MVYDYYKEKNKKSTKKGIIISIIILLAIILFSLCFQVLMDYLQIQEIGQKYLNVFWINFYVKLASMIISFVITFAIFFISTIFIKKNISKINSENIITSAIINKKYPGILLSLFIAFLSSNVLRNTISSKFLLFANSIDFEKADPIFNQDLGYYIFERPFLMSLVDSLSGLWFFQIIFTAIVYVALYTLVSQGVLSINSILKERNIVFHNVINVIIFFAIKALTYKFVSENVLYSNIGEVVGAGYTDINVWLKYYKIAPFLLIIIVIMTLIFLKKGKIKKSLYTIGIFPAVWILVLITATIVQSLIVSPNEVIKEEPYIKNNIEFTRSAYNLNNIIEREFPVENNLTAEFVKNNSQLFENIRITDFNATLNVLNQLQGIRNYYAFLDTDVATYDFDGKKVAVFAGVREMYKENLPEESKNYINIRLRYTHGYGLVMNPVNKVTQEGHPEFVIRDIPTKSLSGSPEISQPRIYFGELTNDYVIVNTKQKELDYAEGQEDVQFSYDGDAGIKMNLFNKLLFAAKFADFRMLISGYINDESKLLLNRNILERVNTVAPFLNYDEDPYIVITDDGRLVWVIDIYTTSGEYPYSQNISSKVNYLRNSGKVIVDAYNGTTDFYITDKSDPIIMAYNKMYPSLFNEEGLPKDIKSHIKYPEQIFNIQAEIFRKYHMTNPSAFYNNADYWSVSKEKYRGEARNVAPYYNLMNLRETESDEEELILMLPYTLLNKDNMVSWLAVRSKDDDYGQMILYKFPKGINVYGTYQIENRIDSSPSISSEMTLWGQGGSEVIRGNLLVIPINNSIIYVEPVYITADSESSLPEMKRVVVAYKDKIVMEPTLQEGLVKIFGDEVAEITQEEVTSDNLMQNLVDTFNELKNASKVNDWETFGEKLKQLDELISVLDNDKIDTESQIKPENTE